MSRFRLLPFSSLRIRLASSLAARFSALACSFWVFSHAISAADFSGPTCFSSSGSSMRAYLPPAGAMQVRSRWPRMPHLLHLACSAYSTDTSVLGLIESKNWRLALTSCEAEMLVGSRSSPVRWFTVLMDRLIFGLFSGSSPSPSTLTNSFSPTLTTSAGFSTLAWASWDTWTRPCFS